MSKIIRTQKPSVLPFYAMALVFLVLCAVLPVYKLWALLAALGGAGALMAQSVKTLEVIAWPDLGCEAVRRLTVEDMPLTVILDAHGGDLYLSGPEAYREAQVK